MTFKSSSIEKQVEDFLENSFGIDDNIIFEYKNKLEKLGVKLRIRGNLIAKE